MSATGITSQAFGFSVRAVNGIAFPTQQGSIWSVFGTSFPVINQESLPVVIPARVALGLEPSDPIAPPLLAAFYLPARIGPRLAMFCVAANVGPP